MRLHPAPPSASMMKRKVAVAPRAHWLLISLLVIPAGPAAAGWPIDPMVNVPVVAEPGYQGVITAVGDGAGGAIVTWMVHGGVPGIFAQHLLASGSVDPTWPPAGARLFSGPNGVFPAIASDGAGGGIVTWADPRAGSYDIYAQHVLASGIIDPAWPAEGLAVCTAVDTQGNPVIVSDEKGGAIVTWEDRRNGGDYDVYAQRVLGGGTVDPGWPVNGHALCVAPYQQSNPRIAIDGTGGAIVTWRDSRSLTNFDPYVQRVNGAGLVVWASGGVALSSNIHDQYWPEIVSDGAGGAIVVWSDHRDGAADIYGQRINGAGIVQWTADGAVVCAKPGGQAFYYSNIAADGEGGVIVAWEEAYDIYAQRLSASGMQLWPPAGVALCTAPNEQDRPFPVPDGTGGAVVIWQDRRVAPEPEEDVMDIFAQRVAGDGTVDSVWPLNGLAVCTASDDQGAPILIADHAGGAIALWQDSRNDPSDPYAQRIDFSGVLGVPILSAVDEVSGWVGSLKVWPNPVSSSRLTIRFTLPGTSAATLELLDVMGRRVGAREVGSLGTGEHTVGFSDIEHLAPGLYMVQLRTERAVRTRRVVIYAP